MFTKQLHLHFPHARLSFSHCLTLKQGVGVCACVLGAWQIMHSFQTRGRPYQGVLTFPAFFQVLLISDLQEDDSLGPAWLQHTFLLSDQGNPFTPSFYHNPWVFPQSSNIPLHIAFLSDIQSLLFTLPWWPPAPNSVDFLKLITSLQSNQKRLFKKFSNFSIAPQSNLNNSLLIIPSWIKSFIRDSIVSLIYFSPSALVEAIVFPKHILMLKSHWSENITQQCQHLQSKVTCSLIPLNGELFQVYFHKALCNENPFLFKEWAACWTQNLLWTGCLTSGWSVWYK